jgi:hypothetical protein
MSAAELYRRGRPGKRACDVLLMRDLDCRANTGPGVRLCAAMSRQIGSTIGGLRRLWCDRPPATPRRNRDVARVEPGPGRVLEIGGTR